MASIEPGTVSAFRRDDVAQLLELMRLLAVFEGYDAAFAVTQDSLIRNGLTDSPLFRAYVVPDWRSTCLLGVAVTFVRPWTYSLRPHLVLKELYVTEQARGQGVGRALMDAVVAEANSMDAFAIPWAVLRANELWRQRRAR